MKNLGFGFVIVLALGLGFDSNAKLATSGNVALTSDYVFRGVSQTNAEPAIQGGIDWTYNNLYWGFWGSPVTFGGFEYVEVDFYGGLNWNMGSGSMSFGLLYYNYWRHTQTNTFEFPLVYSISGFDIGYAFSLDWLGTKGYAGYASIAKSFGLGSSGVTLALAAGFSHFNEDKVGTQAYADFKVGLSKDLLGVTWDISGTAVNNKQATPNDDTRAVFTVSKSM